MGSLPKDWTSANVVLVYKKGDCRVAANYSPISLTSIVVKFMGRIICKQLTAALEQSAGLSNTQWFSCQSFNSIIVIISCT